MRSPTSPYDPLSAQFFQPAQFGCLEKSMNYVAKAENKIKCMT